ncbi:MAG: CPXCG motif-containing cysteine-rich protein, partial [Pseudomonadota bacterium]
DVTCPTCWQIISIVFDLSFPDQTVVEDCQVCCNPMTIHYRAEHGELVDVQLTGE